jgi:hypothetical protein
VTKKWYLQSPVYDLVGIVFAPLIALFIIIVCCEPRAEHGSYLLPSKTPAWLIASVSVLVFMHVLLVVARSHLNREVFTRFKPRFTFIPLVVFAAMAGWNQLFVFMAVAAVVWDEIHSFMQTFGFGRIYDSRLGNDAFTGRKLDMTLCFVQEYLPHLILLSVLPYRDFLEEVNWGDAPWVQWIASVAPHLTYPLVAAAILFVAYYIYRVRKMRQAGYRVSPAKIALFACTAIVNLYVIWQYTVVKAGLLGNIYHSLQYFAVVWVGERGNLLQTFKLHKVRYGFWILGVGLLVVLTAVGITRLFTHQLPVIGAFWLTLSLMHYWYDGFIWSVRRKHV